jgi:hypothetical protein
MTVSARVSFEPFVDRFRLDANRPSTTDASVPERIPLARRVDRVPADASVFRRFRNIQPSLHTPSARTRRFAAGRKNCGGWSCALGRAEVNRRAVVYARMWATWPTSNRGEKVSARPWGRISAIVLVHTQQAGVFDPQSKRQLLSPANAGPWDERC